MRRAESQFKSELQQKHNLCWAVLALLSLLVLSACSGSLLDPPEGSQGDELAIEVLTNGDDQPLKIGVLDGTTISGTVEVVVSVRHRVQRVEFRLDDPSRSGRPAHIETTPPFKMTLDTTTMTNGKHELIVTAVRSGRPWGPQAAVRFIVKNAPSSEPKPPDPPQVPDPSPTPPDPTLPDPSPTPPDPTLPDPSPTPPDPIPTPPDPSPTPPANNPQGTLFVSNSGSDSNDGRTASKPLRTIARAASVVRPGDVVQIRGGVYYEYNEANAWKTSGQPGKPITFMAYPGETVIIDGSKKGPSGSNPSSPQLIRLLDVDWYVFQDLTVRHSGGRGLTLEGDHNVVRNVVSQGNHGDGIYLAGSSNLIEDSMSFDNYSYTNGGDSADGIKIDRGSDNVIRYVTVYENSDDGIDLWDSTHSLVEHVVSYKNGRGTTGNGNGFKLSNGGRADSGNVVRFSTAFSNRAFDFTDNGGGGIIAYNNTSWNAGSFGFVFRGRSGKARHTLANNLSFDDGDGVLMDVQTYGGVAPNQENNSWNLDIDDPHFVSLDASSGDFLKLSHSSPAIDAGMDVGLGYSGRAPDLGASESEYTALRASASAP